MKESVRMKHFQVDVHAAEEVSLIGNDPSFSFRVLIYLKSALNNKNVVMLKIWVTKVKNKPLLQLIMYKTKNSTDGYLRISFL